MSWDKRNQKAKEARIKIFGSEDNARKVIKKANEVSSRDTKEHELPYWEGRDHS